jgi:cell division protease FtsH
MLTIRTTEILMLSHKTKEFIIAMALIVAVAAFVGFVIVSPGPVSAPTNPARIHNTGAAPVTPVSKPAPVKTAPVAQDPDSESGPEPPPLETTHNAMEASDLFALVDTNPKSIAQITFLNGSDVVLVQTTTELELHRVTLPEQGAREQLLRDVRDKHISWTARDDDSAFWRGLVFSFGPIILLAGVWFFFMRRGIANGGAAGSGIKPNIAKAKTTHSDQAGALRKVTFADVAGCDEAKKEMHRIAKGLKRRRLYSFFGAKIPKGALLVGPPGTGKTLLARAVAGETDGTFAATSGSDFVEMFVGVGAARVRDMFEEGRKKVKETGKPHIIFIDEIDAVGGHRGGGPGQSGNSEREQTLNAILVEMDGMKNNEGLIILAATNRVDILDEALVRPGRFDVQLDVDLPNKVGREAIFKIHTRNKPLAPDVSCELLAQRTYGYSGAEIESACNRAALLAAERYGLQVPDEAEESVVLSILRKVSAAIALADFDEGVDFVRYGAANESRQQGMSQSERENTTVHEAGHAIVCDAMPGTDPIVKLTNLSRSKALGYLQNMPSDDRYGLDFVQIIGRIVTAMGGRAAQEAILGKIDTGASNDFEQACGLAYNMVTKWGMSRVGIISVGRSGGGMRGMGGAGPVSNYGPKLADEIDDEWRRIAAECYALAVRIIKEDRKRLEQLIATLKKKETMLVPDWQEFSAENPSEVDKKSLVIDISRPAKEGA